MGPPNEVQPSLSAVVKISKIEAERAATRSADAVAPDSGFMPSLTRAVREVRGPVQDSDFRSASGERHQGEGIRLKAITPALCRGYWSSGSAPLRAALFTAIPPGCLRQRPGA
jgi:hypothetical protein